MEARYGDAYLVCRYRPDQKFGMDRGLLDGITGFLLGPMHAWHVCVLVGDWGCAVSSVRRRVINNSMRMFSEVAQSSSPIIRGSRTWRYSICPTGRIWEPLTGTGQGSLVTLS